MKLKYKVNSGLSNETGPITLKSGGWTAGPGSTWEAYYQGSLTIDLADYFSFAPSSGGAMVSMASGIPKLSSGDYDIEVWAKARDLAGNTSYLRFGDYVVPDSCFP